MKNLFKLSFLALAISLSVAACNSNKSSENTTDSIDSSAEATTDAIDSSADATIDSVDSTAEATKDSVSN